MSRRNPHTPAQEGSRSATAALLAAAIALALVSCFAAPPRAFAATGRVTITAIEGNSADAYKVYQVFKADVGDDDTATHVSWGAGAKAATLAFLDRNAYGDWLAAKGYDAPGAHDNAQNAAEFTSEMVAASPQDARTAGAGAVRAGSFASGLARALAASGAPADTARVGTPYSNDEGYYLIVTDPGALKADSAATAPIWLALGGATTAIEEKSALPSIDKSVKGAGDAGWSNATDAFIGQDIDFRLTATLPANIGAFGSYHLKFADVLDGMDLAGSNTASVSVKVGSADVTGQIAGGRGSIAYAGNRLVVDIADLLALDGVAVGKDTLVTVDYRAHNTPAAASDGRTGGTNSVSISYTADPVSDAETSTSAASKQARAFSYRTLVTKIDKNNKQPLAGARFSVRVKEYPADATLVGKYVQGDGTLGTAVHEFESGQDGTFAVCGLDAGVYTVAETRAPEGYELQDADIELSITADVDGQAAAVTSLAARASGGEAAIVEGDEPTRVTGADPGSGTVELQAADDRSFALASTGLGGLGGNLAIAAALAAAGTAGMAGAARRKGPDGKRRNRAGRESRNRGRAS